VQHDTLLDSTLLLSTGVGFVGLALNYATTISSAMAGLVDVLTRLELDFISVERMQQYTEELELEPPDESMPETTAGWPFRGAVTYKKVSMRYQLTMPLVLREISFTIGAGERVGVVGRTGSGKSSIVACLFRLSEIQSGSIMIDGLDTRNVRLCDLRRSIGVVMQDSLVFAGNARRNLFAPPEVPEAELLQALVDVRLCQSVEEAAVMIDVEIDFNNLSAGQRQLLCIARMLVRKAKLMVMDEATANLDEESDRFVQENLIGAFSGATVMTIAHRTGTVIRSDRILVVSHGQVVEEGLPAELARNSSSKFAQLLAAGKDISE
jgi:ABC-type multidrug transport system fused ATPase/permease subunit